MGRLYQEFRADNCEVLLILGGTTEEARRYAEILHLPFQILADPDRVVYHRYGLEKPLGVVQRTASIVIDQNGLIRYIKEAYNPLIWLKESREVLAFAKSLSPAAKAETKSKDQQL